MLFVCGSERWYVDTCSWARGLQGSCCASAQQVWMCGYGGSGEGVVMCCRAAGDWSSQHAVMLLHTQETCSTAFTEAASWVIRSFIIQTTKTDLPSHSSCLVALVQASSIRCSS